MSENKSRSPFNNLINSKLAVSIITTLLGTVLVAYLTNKVTMNLGDKELQYKAMSALVDYTKVADIEEGSDILKLKALTELIAENEEFRVKVSGFEAIVENFYNNKVINLENELNEATKKGEDKEIIQTKLETIKKQKEEFEKKLELSSTSERSLKKKFIQSEKNLKNSRSKIAGLDKKIENLTKEHIITFEFMTRKDLKSESTDLLQIIFSNKSAEEYKDPDFSESIVAEFTVSGFDLKKGEGFKFTRKVRDKSFSNARFISLINHGTDAWYPEWISLAVDKDIIFDKHKINPNQPPGTKKKYIQNFNELFWKKRSYWEIPLNPKK